MAVLQKIRVKFGVAISVIIALALLSFIIDPGTLESALNSMSSKYDVGLIDGKKISYPDFLEDVERFSTLNEMVSGSTAQSEETNEAIRDAAWQELLDKYLFVKNAKAAGITVGDAEMVSLTSGDLVSPVIAQSPAFQDEQGMFSKDALLQFIQNMDSDQSGRLKMYWNYLQTSVYDQAFYNKYGALFTYSNMLNNLQKASKVQEGNGSVDIEYVCAPYNFLSDSTIMVSNSEGKEYYKKHKDFFKQVANRDMEYVVFEVVPSTSDISDVNEEMIALQDEFASTSTMKTFLLKNSDRQLSNYWYKAGELASVSQKIEDFVAANKTGVSGIIAEGNTFYNARILETAQRPDSVMVKHILLQGENAKSQADSLLGVIKKGGNFSTLAAIYSADRNSAYNGETGNIGWMTQTYMIPGFESVLDAEVGKPFTLDTQYGSHVILVSKKTKPVTMKQVAILEKTALASKETFNEYYAKANKFSAIAKGTYDGYLAAVDSLGVYSHKQNNVLESNSKYGAIESAKEVTRWVFDNKAGKASQIITVNNNYFFIAAVKAVRKDGYQPYEEAKTAIGQVLKARKGADKAMAEVKQKVEGLTTLEAVSEKLGAPIEEKTNVIFSFLNTQSVEPAILGAAIDAEQGKLTGPVQGIQGIYMFRVTDRREGQYYTEEDAANAYVQQAQYKTQMLLPTMMSDAGVKDNRARFF